MFTKRGDRVAQEALALASAHHPGVVELVDVAGGVLRTRMVDARPVGAVGPLAAGEVAGLAAAVAATLADLHDLGIVHGGVEASHVLVTPHGRPVLCSLGRGGEPAEDVAALGRLVTALLATAPPETGGRRRLRGRRGLGPMLAPPAGPTLAALAAEAAVPDPHRRPSARAFADAIGRRIPGARLPRPRPATTAAVVPPPPAPIPTDVASSLPDAPVTPVVPVGPGRAAPPLSHRLQRLRSSKRGAACAVGFAAGVAVVAALAGATVLGRPAPSRPAAPAAAITRTGPPAASTSTPTATAPAAARVWPAEPLEFRDGVLTYRGARYAIGQAGDAVVAGDWGCAGVATLALLRRDVGEVFVFDSWPEGDGEVTGRPVGQVASATNLEVVDADGDGCPELQVGHTAGPPVGLRVVR